MVEAVLEPKTPAELRAANGQKIQMTGIPSNTKASPILSVDGLGSVYCRIGGTHWPSETDHQTITVVGTVVVLPGRIYPVATQDEHGAWSQGVASDALVASPGGPTQPISQHSHQDVVVDVISYTIGSVT